MGSRSTPYRKLMRVTTILAPHDWSGSMLDTNDTAPIDKMTKENKIVEASHGCMGRFSDLIRSDSDLTDGMARDGRELDRT